MKPEEYNCSYEDGSYLRVEPDAALSVFVRTFSNGEEVGGHVYLKPEDIPRLIAQLTAAQGEPEPKGKCERKKVFDNGVHYQLIATHDGGECMSIRQDGTVPSLIVMGKCEAREFAAMLLEWAEPVDSVEQLPPRYTMEMRVAVVTGAINGRCYFRAYGSSYCDDDYLETMATNMANPGKTITSFVTARVPLPPKPETHEVEGKVEVSDGS
jgi:hypothetical protein